MGKIAFVFASFAAIASAGVHAEERVVSLVFKDPEAQRLLLLSRQLNSLSQSVTVEHIKEASFADSWCKDMTLTFWSNSRHPGYKIKPNQNQDGIGIKCRKQGNHPTFFSVDTMTNSQYGATMAVSVGKQIDIIDWEGFKYYYGGSLTWLSYEMEARDRTAYGVVPITHRGVSADLPKLLSIKLPRNFEGTIGWEELRLPKDNIRVRAWNAKIRWSF